MRRHVPGGCGRREHVRTCDSSHVCSSTAVEYAGTGNKDYMMIKIEWENGAVEKKGDVKRRVREERGKNL